MSYEIEGEPTWNANGEWPEDGLYDGRSWNWFKSGPGYSISPTRTPWASWWRPTKQVMWSRTYYLADYPNGPHGGAKFPHMEFHSTKYNGVYHDTFHGPCECGAWHSLPDVQKDNPQ